MLDNETELIDSAKAGNIEAFEKLIAAYQKKVFNIALRMLGNYDDASELAQEVFIKAFKSIKHFKGDSSFSTWIYKITTNVCLDEIRKLKKRKVISLDENIKGEDNEFARQVEDNKPTPDVLVEKSEVKKVVNEAIGALGEEHKTVIVLRDVQGFSYEEIAKMLDCPEGTVKSRINRARKMLKQILLGRKELLFDDYVK